MKSSQSMHSRERMNKWFQPGDGIAREVITADIQRYLGRDALVRPGTQGGADGYWITAYRNLTSEMVTDLKQDSQRWRVEQQGHSTRGAPAYLDSQTHQSRQYYGPSVTPAPPVESHYGAPTAGHSSRDPYGTAPVREAAGYATQAHSGYAPGGYTQSPGSTYPGGQPSGYQEASYQSPATAYSNIHAPTPSAYSSTSSYSASTQATSYSGASPGYPTPAQGGYVTSTTPQSYDHSAQPRTVAGYEGYAQPGARTAADPYAGYRTGQAQAQPGYAYTAGAAISGREAAYQSSQPAGSRYFDTPSRNNVDIWLDDAKPPTTQYDDRGVL